MNEVMEQIARIPVWAWSPTICAVAFGTAWLADSIAKAAQPRIRRRLMEMHPKLDPNYKPPRRDESVSPYVETAAPAIRQYPAFDPYHEPDQFTIQDLIREIETARRTGESIQFPVEFSNMTNVVSSGETPVEYHTRLILEQRK